MAFTWSKAQLEAIEYKDSNVLVSAGAGSGKTAVLTERIFRLVKEGYSISRFLVLTFTKAAAQEMKNRIRDKLNSDPTLQKASSEIDNSHICTFDAFALFIVQKYCHEIGLSSNISIFDNSIKSIRLKKIIKDVLIKEHQNKNSIFMQMINRFCLKDEGFFHEILFNIINKANQEIDKGSFYQTIVDKTYHVDFINSFLKKDFSMMIDMTNEMIKKAYDISNEKRANMIIELGKLLLSNHDYDSFVKCASTQKFPNKTKEDDDDIQIRNECLILFDDINGLCKYGTSQIIIDDFLNNKPFAEYFLNIAKQADDLFLDYKKTNNVFDFSDVARFALELLSDSRIQKEVKDSFDFILVDEYQDTSDIQEKVINLLDKNNIYMVGDIKQSIYRYREANCNIFHDKFEKYKNHNGGKEIDLNQSFRSRPEIINFVNETFLTLMNPNDNIIDYDKGHAFEYMASSYEQFIDNKEDYRVKAYLYSEEEGKDKGEQEIEIIADDIIYKINHHYQVFDKKINTFRDCTFHDFAIIMDRGTSFNKYRLFFNKKGIPLYVNQDESINSSALLLITKNLIKLFYYVSNGELNNEFIHAYCSIARSFLLRMDDQELYTIVSNSLFAHTELYQIIDNAVNKNKNNSLYQILFNLYLDFNIFEKALTLDNINKNLNDVELYLGFASSLDQIGSSIKGFVDFFDDLQNEKLEIKFPSVKESDNAVIILNIHKSKGLEYPILYLPGLFKKFNREEYKKRFVVDRDFGIVLPNIDIDGANPYIKDKYIIQDIQEDYEEKIRLLYVAITRVRERLIFVAPKLNKPYSNSFLPSSNSFLEILTKANVINDYGIDYQMHNESLLKTNEISDTSLPDLRTIKMSSSIKENKKASKEIDNDVDASLLAFGNTLHHLLEVVDYETKDTSFIKDQKLRQYVNNVLSCSLFNNIKNNQIIHEYEFFDEINDVHGFIDCLIIKENEFIIVDFKLKNITDNKYSEQLKTYRSYIAQLTNKKIRMVLLSIMTGEEKEIE